MKHTPGNWFVETAMDSPENFGISARMGEEGDELHWKELATVYSNEERDEQGRYNAKLIASAPDMYEALKMIVEYEERGRAKGEPRIADKYFLACLSALNKATN